MNESIEKTTKSIKAKSTHGEELKKALKTEKRLKKVAQSDLRSREFDPRGKLRVSATKSLDFCCSKGPWICFTKKSPRKVPISKHSMAQGMFSWGLFVTFSRRKLKGKCFSKIKDKILCCKINGSKARCLQGRNYYANHAQSTLHETRCPLEGHCEEHGKKKASSAKRKKGKHVKKIKLALRRIFRRQIPRKGLHKYPILYSEFS